MLVQRWTPGNKNYLNKKLRESSLSETLCLPGKDDAYSS